MWPEVFGCEDVANSFFALPRICCLFWGWAFEFMRARTNRQAWTQADTHTQNTRQDKKDKTRQDKTRRDTQRELNMQTDKPTQTCTQTETSIQTFSQAGAQTKL